MLMKSWPAAVQTDSAAMGPEQRATNVYAAGPALGWRPERGMDCAFAGGPFADLDPVDDHELAHVV